MLISENRTDPLSPGMSYMVSSDVQISYPSAKIGSSVVKFSLTPMFKELISLLIR